MACNSILKWGVVYPMVIPVLLTHNLTMYLWRKSLNTRWDFGIIFLCVLFPYFSLLGGLEFILHRSNSQSWHWVQGIAGYIGIQIVVIGLVVPAVFLVVQPLLRFLSYLQYSLLKFIESLDRMVTTASVKILARLSPFWNRALASFRSRIVDSETFHSNWFRIASRWFGVLSLGTWAVIMAMPVWNFAGLHLVPFIFPSWISWYTTHSFQLLFAVLVLWPFVGAARIVLDEYYIHQSYFHVAEIFVLDLVIIPQPIWFLRSDYQWHIINLIHEYIKFDLASYPYLNDLAYRSAFLFILFLFIFSVGLPILGSLSTARNLGVFISRIVEFWGNFVKDSVKEVYIVESNILQISLIPPLLYMFGNYVSAHYFNIAIHALLGTLFAFCVPTYASWLSTTTGYVALGIARQYDLSYPPLISSAIHMVILILSGIVCFLVVYPFFVHQIVKLFIAVWPNVFDVWIAKVRRTIINVCYKIRLRWNPIMDIAYGRQSIFGATFGWLLAIVISLSLVYRYGEYYLTVTNSPLLLASDSIFSLPNLNFWLFEEAANVTATIPAAPVYMSLSEVPAMLGHVVIDYFVFLFVIGQILLAGGKAASMNPMVSLVWVIWVVTFISTIPRPALIRTSNPILSTLIVVEICMLLCFTIAPLGYAGLSVVLNPYMPQLGPKILYPFEKLWYFYMWCWRVTIRQYYNLRDVVDHAWMHLHQWLLQSFFRPLHENDSHAKRVYVVRPRRFND